MTGAVPMSVCNPSVQRDNWRWMRQQTGSLPAAVQAALAAEWTRQNETDYRAANMYIDAVGAAMREAHVAVAHSEDEIRLKAARAARFCQTVTTAAQAIRFAEASGLEPPKGRHVTVRSAWRRLKDAPWWRHRLRRTLTRRAEDAIRAAGLVHRRAAPYVCDDGFNRYRDQAERIRRFVQAHEVVCEQTGELFPLAEVVEGSISNPAIRRGELMLRARGFEELAAARGDGWIHVTLTAPSAFHAYGPDGRRNPRWLGVKDAGVRDGQRWLCKQWARSRAKLARLSILYYGIRTAEPHHDGTPHWHLLIFAAPSALATIEQVLRGYWLADYADEPGAREHRVKVVAGKGEGSAAGYIAKYISKNTDGHEFGDSDESAALSGSDAAARATAWARIHGIRQFQQIGGPAVTIWRELRRLREPVEPAPIERARLATDKPASWHEFVNALGGIEVCRRDPVITLDKDMPRVIDREGRNVARLNAWDEWPEDRVVGVRHLGPCERIQRVCTRPLTWRIERRVNTPCGEVPVMNPQGTGETGVGSARLSASFSAREARSDSDLGPVAITVRAGTDGANEGITWKNREQPARAGPPEKRSRPLH